jgi:hypothetical protein
MMSYGDLSSYHAPRMRLLRRLDIAAQLPPSGPARAAVIGSLVLGAIAATALTTLIAIFFFTLFGSR